MAVIGELRVWLHGFGLLGWLRCLGFEGLGVVWSGLGDWVMLIF